MRGVEQDVVLAVCGVPTDELLRRLQQTRSGAAGSAASQTPDNVDRWRLVDFGDGTDEQFVEAVHLALLRRSVTPAERERRLRDLAAGRRRVGLVVRLALCPEGRRRGPKPTDGVVLPALVRVGGAVDMAASHSALGRVVAAARPTAALLLGGSPRARRARRVGRALAEAGLVLVAMRSRGHRRGLGDLGAQLADRTRSGS